MNLIWGEDELQSSILKHAPIGLCLLDAATLVAVFVNDTFVKIAGKPHEAICSHYYWDAFSEVKPYYEESLSKAAQEGIPFSIKEVPLMLIRNGKENWIYTSFEYCPIKDKNNKTVKVAIWMEENTQQVKNWQSIQELNEELAISNEELKKTNEEIVAVNNRLSESEERFRTMAEATDVLITVTDETGSAVYFNQAWAGLTGRPVEEFLQFGWVNLLHPEDKKPFLNLFLNAMETHLSFTTELQVMNKEHQYRWLFVSETPRFYQDGAFAGSVSSCIDITEIKKDDQRKSDFINIVSHELKTPLTSINGYVQLLQARAQTAEDTVSISILQKTYNQICKMTTMINGFLNVSRLESGKIQIDKTQFDMALLIKGIEEEILSAITSHNILFAPVEPTHVLADRDKIGQVVDNLISNAIKYSPSGTTIQVACVAFEGIARVSIKDNGIGIHPEDIGKIFDRYYRVAGDRRVSGFGIGLYLSAEIIKRHYGEIWVESKPGQGSTFCFSLPIV